MAASGFTFLLSMLAAQILSEHDYDHKLEKGELSKERKWRSICVLAMLIPAALIAFSLFCFIR